MIKFLNWLREKIYGAKKDESSPKDIILPQLLIKLSIDEKTNTEYIHFSFNWAENVDKKLLIQLFGKALYQLQTGGFYQTIMEAWATRTSQDGNNLVLELSTILQTCKEIADNNPNSSLNSPNNPFSSQKSSYGPEILIYPSQVFSNDRQK